MEAVESHYMETMRFVASLGLRTGAYFESRLIPRYVALASHLTSLSFNNTSLQTGHGSKGMYVNIFNLKVKSLSCVRLFATPWTGAY